MPGGHRVYSERQELNEKVFDLLQPPPPEDPDYSHLLREVGLRLQSEHWKGSCMFGASGTVCSKCCSGVPFLLPIPFSRKLVCTSDAGSM